MAAVLQPPTRYVFRVARPRGPVWYAKYRLPHGGQVQNKIDPASTGRGWRASGSAPKRRAERWLRWVLPGSRRARRVALARRRLRRVGDPSALQLCGRRARLAEVGEGAVGTDGA